DRVADELLHGAAMPLQDDPGLLVVARHDPPELLRILLLAETRGAGHVAEQDRDGLPHLSRHGRLHGERAPTGPAEPSPVGVRRAATRTIGPGLSVRRSALRP